jgi:hypothetical protein
VGGDGVKRRAVPSQLKATQATAWHMVGDGGVKRRAVSRQLLQEARRTARRMVEDDGVKQVDCFNLTVARSVYCRLST